MEDQKPVVPREKKDWRAAFSNMHWAYAVPFIIALALLVWAYSDKYGHNLDAQMSQLYISIQKLGDWHASPNAAGTGEESSFVQGEKNTYAAALGEFHFQIDLPAGYHLSVGDAVSGDASAYVIPDATVANETPIPDMVISLVSLKTEFYASRLGKDEPGTRLVAAADGKSAFWITGWEDRSWPEFDKVAASFKAL